MWHFVEADILPENCPPDDAQGITGTFYRLSTLEAPIEADDFMSNKHLGKPRIGDYTDCEYVSLSIWARIEDCYRIKKYPKTGDFIMELFLLPKDGPIKQSGKSPHHRSWWRSNQFDIKSVKIVL